MIGRQEVHLQWLADAIGRLGGTSAEMSAPGETGKSGRDGDRSLDRVRRPQPERLYRSLDAASSDQVTNARNRKMLNLILGEMKEHLRVLQQAAEGRTDLLGRHSDGKVLRGEVMADRPKN